MTDFNPAMNGHQKPLRLGLAVEYHDGSGHRKLALVTGTAETIDDGTPLPVPGEGRVHLTVLSPTGTHYPAFDIPPGEGPHTFSTL